MTTSTTMTTTCPSTVTNTTTTTIVAPSTRLTLECPALPTYQIEGDTAKCFADLQYEVKLPTIDELPDLRDNIIYFLTDYSGSMGADCGGMSRQDACREAILSFLRYCAQPSNSKKLKTDSLRYKFAMRVFATTCAEAIKLQCIESKQLEDSAGCPYKGLLFMDHSVGGSTAIQENVERVLTELETDNDVLPCSSSSSSSSSSGVVSSLFGGQKQQQQQQPNQPAKRNVMIVVMTDGWDNSGTMPWTDDAARDGSMEAGLNVMAAKIRSIERSKQCMVQLCFVGVSKDACWNVIRTLNKHPGLSGMGGVVNQDGLQLTDMLTTFANKFWQTRYLDMCVRFKVSEPADAGVLVRILDTSLPPSADGKDSKEQQQEETFGAGAVRTPWQVGQTEKRIGTMVGGQTVTLVGQIQFKLRKTDLRSETAGLDRPLVCMDPLPAKGRIVVEAQVVAVDTLHQLARDTSSNDQKSSSLLLPVLARDSATWQVKDDLKELQFDQSVEKFELRVTKQRENVKCVVEQLYAFLDQRCGRLVTKAMLDHNKDEFEQLCARLMTVLQDIQKDRTQELVDRIQRFCPPRAEAEAEAERRMMEERKRVAEDPFYYPEVVVHPDVCSDRGNTEQYNALCRSVCVLLFYLKHPAFCNEAAAKLHEFTRPDREFDAVSKVPVFCSINLQPRQAALFYDYFIIDLPSSSSSSSSSAAADNKQTMTKEAEPDKTTTKDNTVNNNKKKKDKTGDDDDSDDEEEKAKKTVPLEQTRLALDSASAFTDAEVERAQNEVQRAFTQGFRAGCGRPVTSYPESVLMAIVHYSLKKGLSSEEMTKFKADAAKNESKSSMRYRRSRRK